MVKHFKTFKSLMSKKKSTETDALSPVIQLNSEPIQQNRSTIHAEEDVYLKVNNYLNNGVKNIGRSVSNIETTSSNTSLDSFGEKDSKNDRKIKKQLTQEGVQVIAELISHLNSNKQLVKSKLDIDKEDQELLESIESAVDLDKFFEEKKSKVKDKLWRTPYAFKQRNDKNVSDLSANGLHSVNRFGDGVNDGCNVSLSLASKGRSFGDVFQKTLEWNDIIEEADHVLHEFENVKKGRRARRGSLLQPRYIFLSPHPEITYERVLQSANCLPLRAWTSELFLESKESSKLLDSENKRNLKWNASLEDFRHLLSPELSHFGNDVYSMLIQAKRRASLCPPQLDTESIPFRRNSYRNGEVWTPNDSKNHKKKDYVQKLEVIRQNSNFSSTNTSPELVTKKTANTLLTVPNDSDLKHMKKKSIDYKRNISNESIEFINIESMSPKVVANELTLIARQLFLSMKSTEIIALLIRPHSISPDSCSNIAALLGFQKRLIQLIPSYILKVIDNQICAQRIAYFIEVAKELKALENWHSVYSVILSLQSPPIARLRECWRIVSDDFSDSYCEFIEISEQIKREAEPLAHSSPSIPLFDEFIDDLKERCGAKYLEIKTHRLRSHWSTTDTIAVWVDKEIDHLIGVAKDKKKIQKKVENIRKSSVEMKPKKSILKKLMRRRSISSKEVSDSLSTGTDSRNDSIASLNTEKLKLRLMHEKGVKPSFKNIWSVADIQRLRDFEEKEILEEIVRGLVVYQRKANDYHLNESNQSVRDFLLLQSYKELDDCLKRSYLLEAKTLKKTSNQLIPAN